MCDIHEHVTLATIMQKDVFDHNVWTKAVMTMILASRSMFFRSINPMVPFLLKCQGHDLCKSHFWPYLSYYWAKPGQILAQGSLGKGI